MSQHELQFLGCDAAFVVFAEHAERLLQLVLRVRVADLLVHQVAELGKLNKSRSINVNLPENRLV